MFRRFYLEIKEELERVFRENDWETNKLKIEEPREIADLATATAFELASKKEINPIKIAQKIKNQIKLDELTYVREIEATEPGYINFYMNEKKLNDFIKEINQSKDDFGVIKENKENIVIEHTSANPTGPLHIGHLRNAVIGDILSNILEKSGYSTQTQYYLNDMGKQMAILLLGKKMYSLRENKSLDKAIGEIYSKTNSKKEYDEKEVQKIMKSFEDGDPEIKKELNDLVDKCFSGMINSLNKLQIQIDEVIKESKFVFDNSVQEIFEELKPHMKEKGGAYLIEFDDFDKELILKRNDGTSVYALRDLAYHKWKSKFGKNIDILGSDHKLYIKQLKKALQLIDLEVPETIIFEFVSLPKGEMSSRKGDFVSIDELYEEVKKKAYEEVDKRREGTEEWKKNVSEKIATAAIKYDFIRVAPNKPIKFDLETAVSFKEQGAPFIQYSYARAHSILKKSSTQKPKLHELKNRSSKELAKKISKFSYILEKSAEKRRPHLFAEYVFELARSFNNFYRDVPVLDSEKKEKETRLSLVIAAKVALEKGINTLGFEAPEEM